MAMGETARKSCDVRALLCRIHRFHDSLLAMTRAEAIAKLKEHADAIRALGGTSLYLFGSTSRDEAREDSDLDLFMDYDPDGPFNALDLVAAKRLLENGLGVPVDLTTRNGLHRLISREIQAEAIRIF